MNPVFNSLRPISRSEYAVAWMPAWKNPGPRRCLLASWFRSFASCPALRSRSRWIAKILHPSAADPASSRFTVCPARNFLLFPFSPSQSLSPSSKANSRMDCARPLTRFRTTRPDMSSTASSFPFKKTSLPLSLPMDVALRFSRRS